MHKAKLGQEQNKRTYKDGKDNMTVTRVHCPVASPGVSGMLGEEGMCSLRGYSMCSPYTFMLKVILRDKECKLASLLIVLHLWHLLKLV